MWPVRKRLTQRVRCDGAEPSSCRTCSVSHSMSQGVREQYPGGARKPMEKLVKSGHVSQRRQGPQKNEINLEGV